MKILIDCRFWGLEHAGLGRYVSGLVKNLLEIDKKNKYILLAAKEKQKEISSSLPTAEVVSVEARHYSLKEQIVVPFVLQRQNYDLLHFPHFNLPLLAGFKKPLVLTIHDLIKDESRGLETTTRHPVVYLAKYLGYKLTMFQALRKAEKIIVPSEWVKREVIRRYRLPKNKLVVICEGVGEEFRMEKPKHGNAEEAETRRVLNKYKIKKPYFIYVGSAYPHKNLRNLIFALKLLNQSLNHSCPDVHRGTSGSGKASINLVVVCSRDIFWQRLKKEVIRAEAEKYINLAGFVKDSDLRVLYNQAVAFVTPSLMEGFGLPGIEAMASGCPVLVSRKAALPEVYEKAAAYFDPENLSDIKNKMAEILKTSDKEREKIIQRGFKQAQKYSWEKCAKETIKVYREIANC